MNFLLVFFFLLPSPYWKESVTFAEISLPKLQSDYINNHPLVQGAFDWCVIVQKMFPGIWIDNSQHLKSTCFLGRAQGSVVGVDQDCPPHLLTCYFYLLPLSLPFTGEIDWHLNHPFDQEITRWWAKLHLRSAATAHMQSTFVSNRRLENIHLHALLFAASLGAGLLWWKLLAKNSTLTQIFKNQTSGPLKWPSYQRRIML